MRATLNQAPTVYTLSKYSPERENPQQQLRLLLDQLQLQHLLQVLLLQLPAQQRAALPLVPAVAKGGRGCMCRW
jgi:hypothetical protein